MRKYKFKFLMKNPTRSESARCGELNGFSAHLDAFLKSTLFLLTAALLTLGSFFSQAYGVSSAQYQEEENFSYVSYKLEAAQVAEVLLEIGVSPEKVEEVLRDVSLSEDQKLTLLFHETKGLWVFDTSKHGPPVILIACKWYQVVCVVEKGVEEVADYANRVVTSAIDDIEEVVEEVSDYTNRVVTSAVDDAEEVLEYGKKLATSARDDIKEAVEKAGGPQPDPKYMEKLRKYQKEQDEIFEKIFWERERERRKKEQEKREKKSSQKDQGLPAERRTIKVDVLGVGVEHSSENNKHITGKQKIDAAKTAIKAGTSFRLIDCGDHIRCGPEAQRNEFGHCCDVIDFINPNSKENGRDFGDLKESELPEAMEAPPEEPRDSKLQST